MAVGYTKLEKVKEPSVQLKLAVRYVLSGPLEHVAAQPTEDMANISVGNNRVFFTVGLSLE
jgi:hypothetical protein